MACTPSSSNREPGFGAVPEEGVVMDQSHPGTFGIIGCVGLQRRKLTLGLVGRPWR